MTINEFREKCEKIPVEQYSTKAPDNPMLSVCVQTYQHVNYIRECLDGVLMQDVDFEYEILLGEDDSNDGTREICIEYAEKYPDKIRLFLHKRENNIKINGRPSGRFNFLNNLYNAKGKYIALCEGDDYWTDPLKLQKQIDFLEQNDDYSLCFHKTLALHENSEDDYYFPDFNCETTIERINLYKGNIIPTCSIVFRNRKELPSGIEKIPFGDWPLHLYNLGFGKGKYFNNVMGVYRINTTSYWSSQMKIAQIRQMVSVFDYYQEKFVSNKLEERALKKGFAKWSLRLCFILLKNNDFRKCFKTTILTCNSIGYWLTLEMVAKKIKRSIWA